MNTKSYKLVVGMLMMSLVILGCLLVGSLLTEQTVMAGTPAGLNQYMICPVKFKSNQDIVFVIDVQKSRMNAYCLDENGRTIEPAKIQPAEQFYDLRQMFENSKQDK